LGGEVLLFNLEGNGISEEALERVKSLSFVKEAVVNNSELSVVAENAEVALPEVIELLRSMSVSTAKISIAKPTLDHVFLKYAGTRLETSGRIAEARQVRRMIKSG